MDAAAAPHPAPLDRERLLRFGAPPLFVLLWASGYVVVRVALVDTDPLTLLAVRYALVVAVLLPVVLVGRLPWPRGRAWLHLAVVGVLVQALYFAGINLSIRHGLTAGASALISCLQPILVGLLAPLLAHEHVSPRRWLGLVLGLAGAAMVILGRAQVGGLPVIGLLFAAVSLGGMTAGTLYERRFGTRTHPVMASLVQCAVALALVLPLAAWLEPMRLHPSLSLVLSLGYLVFGNSIVALALLLAMLRAGEASRVSALFFLVPPTTAAIAWATLGDRLPPLGWAGFAVSCAGVALVTLRRRTRYA